MNKNAVSLLWTLSETSKVNSIIQHLVDSFGVHWEQPFEDPGCSVFFGPFMLKIQSES
jgi:hypothetical protein